MKSKLSTAKKSKTAAFSRIFPPRKIDNFLGKSKLIFWTKNEDFEQCVPERFANYIMIFVCSTRNTRNQNRTVVYLDLPQSQQFSFPGIRRICLALGLTPRCFLLSSSLSESSHCNLEAWSEEAEEVSLVMVSCRAEEMPCWRLVIQRR